jgi:hypothetical protein
MGRTSRQSKLSRFSKAFWHFFSLSPVKPSFPNFTSKFKNSRGSAMVMAAIFMMVAVTLITVGMKIMSNSAKQSVESDLYIGEAQNVARAGIIDALGWFRRNSTTAPVKAFSNNPAPNTTGTWAINPATGSAYTYVDQPFYPQSNVSNPAKNDTLDPTIGIVNEYSVDSSDNSLDADVVFMGRYEVRQQSNPTPGPSTPDPRAVHDITGERIPDQVNGNGLVWAINSTGYIYKRQDKTFCAAVPPAVPSPGVYYFPGAWNVPYSTFPNKVVATAKIASEIRKLSINLPLNPNNNATTMYGGIYLDDNKHITLPSNSFGFLNGAVSTTTFASVGLSSATCPDVAVNATTFTCQGPETCFSNGLGGGQYLTSTSIFGMTLNDIQNIADFRGDPVNNPLNITQNWSLSYFQGSVTYGGNSTVAPYIQLNSDGILVVNGDLTLLGAPSGSTSILASNFGGIVFVTGNLTVQDGSEIEGCVIMGQPYYHTGVPGTVTINGSAGFLGNIIYNPGLVNTATQLVATYREDISARKTLLAVPGLQ